jgi:NAD(P)-dependent dehydrogenase (short-subunit alcohol dehydrogenase family)
LEGDVGSSDFAKIIREASQRNSGGLDVLCNNAGVAYVGMLAGRLMSVPDMVITTSM